MPKAKADREWIFGERSEASARALGKGVEHLDLNRVHVKQGGRVIPPQWSRETDVEYRAAMTKGYGAERAEKILREGPPHFCIFPNLIFILNQFRVIQPVSVNETVINYYPTMLKGETEVINSRLLSETYLIHGPAGGVAPDDVVSYERNHLRFRAPAHESVFPR